MLVYGTAIFVMEKISGDEKLALSKLAFGLYFLGLANLLFGWSHHTYPIPNAPFIGYLGYIISMTELLLLLGKSSGIGANACRTSRSTATASPICSCLLRRCGFF